MLKSFLDQISKKIFFWIQIFLDQISKKMDSSDSQKNSEKVVVMQMRFGKDSFARKFFGDDYTVENSFPRVEVAVPNHVIKDFFETKK